jgi:hypothetical protein
MLKGVFSPHLIDNTISEFRLAVANTAAFAIVGLLWLLAAELF